MKEQITTASAPTAAILVIGDEILSGRTQDKNIGYIAAKLTEIGIDLKEVRVVSDETEDIVDAVNALRARYHQVFTTGGIGPTHDDITADSIAAAFGVSIDVDDRAIAHMKARYANDELTPARLRMARIPQGADLVENPVSRAPGFHIENVWVMAGVPDIMQAMLANILPLLEGGPPMISASMEAGMGEGMIAAPLGNLQEEFPDVSMGSYPYQKNGRFQTSIVLRSRDQGQLEKAEASLKNLLNTLRAEQPITDD